MPPQEPTLTECCQYCPHRKPVTGSCEHAIRQAVVKQLTENRHGVCPVFRDVRTRAMDGLADRLESQS